MSALPIPDPFADRGWAPRPLRISPEIAALHLAAHRALLAKRDDVRHAAQTAAEVGDVRAYDMAQQALRELEAALAKRAAVLGQYGFEISDCKAHR